MTDEFNDNQPQSRRRRGGSGAPAPPPVDDDLAALERLQSLTSATASPSPAAPPETAGRPAASQRPPQSPRQASARPAALAPRASRPRPAASPRAGRMVARIAAPAVFLIAVVVLLSIVVQSGVMGGDTGPVTSPTPAATKTKNGGGTSSEYKVYVVKSGDTLSAIAVKFDTSTSEIEALNPKISSSTLVTGTKIKVPRPAP